MAACAVPSDDRSLPDEELQRVRDVIKQYAAAWEAEDSAAVLALFTEDAVISPSGLAPREGKQAMREFWFPDDSSTVQVHAYSIDVLQSGGSSDLAFSTEHATLSFTYTRNDMSVTRNARSYATTLYRKDEAGDWRIFHRMWTDVRVEH